MITIDPKFKKEIALIRASNKARDAMIDEYIRSIGDRAGLVTADEHEALWDHIMNESEWTVKYEKDKKK
jgi:hypothetical protein